MSKTAKTNLFSLFLAALFTFIIYSCSEENVTNTNTGASYDNNSINGTVTFVDTNFIRSGGSYLISAYPESGWPPMGPPTSYDTIKINGTQLLYNYKLTAVPNGKYVVTVGFRKAIGGSSPVMGIYGCDTSHSITCLLSPTLKAEITNDKGVGNINFISWSDTAKKIY